MDHDAVCTRLLVRTLRRDFPGAQVQLSTETDTAARALATGAIDVVVVHETAEVDVESVIRALRGVKDVPIIVLCEAYRSEEVLDWGATAIITLDKWLG